MYNEKEHYAAFYVQLTRLKYDSQKLCKQR